MFLRATTGRRPVRRAWAIGAAAAATALTLGLTGCSAGGSGSSSPSDTLVVYTGQAGDY